MSGGSHQSMTSHAQPNFIVVPTSSVGFGSRNASELGHCRYLKEDLLRLNTGLDDLHFIVGL